MSTPPRRFAARRGPRVKFLVVLAGLVGGALLLAAPASAHATVVGSTPADGSRLTSAPSSVTIRFDEGVGVGTLGYLHVTDSSGRVVSSGGATHPSADTVTVALRPGLGDGGYLASFRVVSADSHPVSGTIRFVVGRGPLPVAPAGTGAGGSSAPLALSRWISYGGLALLGGGWLLLTVWPAGRDDRRARALVWSGWGGAVLGALLELLLQGPYAAGRPVTGLFGPSLIDATLHTDYGQLHCARLVLLGALAVVLALALQPGRVSRTEQAYWPLSLGLAYTVVAAGHATTTSPAWLSIGVSMLHLVAMAAWVGGLAVVGIALLPRHEPAELRVVLPVFSRVAFASVVALAVTGAYQAARGVGSWRALVETAYGGLVLAKIVGLVGLVLLGNLSRTVIQRRVRRPVVAYAMTDTVVDPPPPVLDEVATERMRRSVLVEVVIAAVVLALAAVLVGQPRGAEALDAQDRAPVTATAPLAAGSSARVTVAPGRHGDVSVEIAVPGRPQSVTATAADPARQLGPLPLPLTREGPGLYTASAVDLPVAGTWVIALVVASSPFDAVTTQARVTLS